MELIHRKIARLETELAGVMPLSELEEAIIKAKIEVLKEILKEDRRKYCIALLKDNQWNYDCGMISTEEYHSKIEEINQLKNK